MSLIMDNDRTSRWELISRQKVVLFLCGFLGFLLLIFRSEPGFVFMVDHANLLFHEAGHPIYGLLGPTLGLYGGTMGQLTFPVILAISFYRKANPIGFAAAGIWFFENWLNISRYMADARAQALPLVGGGEHDWFNIFGRWHVLGHDFRIASYVKTTGWVGMFVFVAWFCWVAFSQRHLKPNNESRFELP
ncbi:MAG: hypothetical protein JWM04_2109 [Verrucomicrobiales bacterium]|nr:hypothetical protein [Verrucomicrobiales bacterium]